MQKYTFLEELTKEKHTFLGELARTDYKRFPYDAHTNWC